MSFKILFHKIKNKVLIGEQSVKHYFGLLGVWAIICAQFAPELSSTQNNFSSFAVICLLIASIFLYFEITNESEVTTRTLGIESKLNNYWYLSHISTTTVAMLLTQSWFRTSGYIAGGDIAPPIGTSWIGKLFQSYTWGGGNSTTFVSNQIDLPWAFFAWITQLLGGSSGMAQRCFYTFLIGGIVLAASLLARALNFDPITSAAISLVYFYNPLTLSLVNVYSNFLTTMILIALFPAILLFYGESRISFKKTILTFCFCSPLIGFTYSNPPLLGLIVLATFATPALSYLLKGKDSGLKILKALTVIVPMIVGISSYWLIPAIMVLTHSSFEHLANTGSWIFTESRATLSNAFWLNTTWGWNYSEYFPYAKYFSQYPLEIIKILVPITVFAPLAFKTSNVLDSSKNKLLSICAITSLFLFLFSNGTNSPGKIVFYPFYSLPFGWLFREPGRFLILTALLYALMAGITIEYLAGFKFKINSPKFEKFFNATNKKIIISGIVIIIALSSSFPLWTGQVVRGQRDGFPTEHVKTPEYWTKTINYLNSSLSPKGSLLVLPKDINYTMLYSWYYGADSFIAKTLNRNVINPLPTTYLKVKGNVYSLVSRFSDEILSHNWRAAEEIQNELGARLIIIRGDTQPEPTGLIEALNINPLLTSIHKSGPLLIYQSKNCCRMNVNHKYYSKEEYIYVIILFVLMVLFSRYAFLKFRLSNKSKQSH